MERMGAVVVKRQDRGWARCRGFLSLLVTATWLCSVGKALAGDNVWTTNGPFGKRVLSLGIDPSTPQTVYAGTDGGLFKSTDGGGTWADVGLINITKALGIDPSNP